MNEKYYSKINSNGTFFFMDKSTKINKKILIIEDDEDMQQLISMMLSEAGYSTIAAGDGLEGINVAKEIKPDLIMLDLMLPKIDGLEVCKRLSDDAEMKKIPIIITTIKKELSTKLSAYMAGARRYVTKPFGKEELISEVYKTLQQAAISEKISPQMLDPRD